MVQHHLVVLNQVHFSLVFVTVVILTLAVHVAFLCHCGCMAFVTLAEAV